MPTSVLVRLNLPGFASPEPFRLADAPSSIAGLACAVLLEIGGFNQEELEAVRNQLDQVPLTLLGELCAGQLVELGSDAELGVFLATAESPKGPPIIEVRPRNGQAAPLSPSWPTAYESPAAASGMSPSPAQAGDDLKRRNEELQEQLQLQEELQMKQRQLQQQQVELQQQFELHARERDALKAERRIPAPTSLVEPLPSSSRWDVQETQRLKHSPSEPSMARQVNGSGGLNGFEKPSKPLRSPTPSSLHATPPERRERRSSAQEASSRASSVSSRTRSIQESSSVHLRLYQEKDDRRRRLEQARLRRLEQEEEDLREAAQKALGRQPSPARRREPSPGPKAEARKPPMPRPEERKPFKPPRKAESEDPRAETSSIASDLGQPSLGTGVEESCCEASGEEVQRLRQQVSSQQQRIDFLEKMHQQALKQLKTSREELAEAQRQRLNEADKVLSLEALIGELQVHGLDGHDDWLRRARRILEGE